MAISPETRALAESALEEFCREHSSAPGADPLRYTVQFETSAALLIQQRPGFLNAQEWVSTPIAKFRYSEARDEWSLYWRDGNDRWHRVSNTKADKDIRVLLKIVVSDPLGVFWS